MSDREIEIAYKNAITNFLEGGGADTLAAIADELAKFNRNLPTLMQKMDSLRFSIDRMPRTVRMRP